MKYILTLSTLGAALLTSSASANVITVSTATGAMESGGNAVNASAVFTTSADMLTITLSDLLNNPLTVAQGLSDVSFSLTTGQTAGTLSSSSGLERTIASNGTFTDGSSVSTGWALTSSSSGLFELSVLGTKTAPSHVIIGGPDSGGVYSLANNSIAGNKPHNAFLADSASFTLSIPGVTSSSGISDVSFSFGTTAGNNVIGTPNVSVPDGGTTALLLGAAFAGLGLVRRRLG